MAHEVKRRIITHALFAGWRPDVNQSDWFRKILVLKKNDYSLGFFHNEFVIYRKDRKSKAVIFSRSYRRIKFSPANDFELVFVCAKRGKYFTFNLKSPDGLTELEHDHELDPLLVGAQIILESLVVRFGRAPYFAEFSGQIKHELRLSDRKTTELIRRGTGKHWRVEKMNEMPPRHYYYPVGQ